MNYVNVYCKWTSFWREKFSLDTFFFYFLMLSTSFTYYSLTKTFSVLWNQQIYILSYRIHFYASAHTLRNKNTHIWSVGKVFTYSKRYQLYVSTIKFSSWIFYNFKKKISFLAVISENIKMYLYIFHWCICIQMTKQKYFLIKFGR